MKLNPRELAKFLSGLVLGDFIVGLWYIRAGEPRITFLGLQLSEAWVPFWLGADIILFVVLVYYAWFSKKKK